jgi:hypothetical protein
MRKANVNIAYLVSVYKVRSSEKAVIPAPVFTRVNSGGNPFFSMAYGSPVKPADDEL